MPPCPAENKSLENRALSASGGRHVTENIILIRGGRIGNCYGKAEALKEFEGHMCWCPNDTDDLWLCLLWCSEGICGSILISGGGKSPEGDLWVWDF